MVAGWRRGQYERGKLAVCSCGKKKEEVEAQGSLQSSTAAATGARTRTRAGLQSLRARGLVVLAGAPVRAGDAPQIRPARLASLGHDAAGGCGGRGNASVARAGHLVAPAATMEVKGRRLRELRTRL